MADPRDSDSRDAVVVGFDGSDQARLAVRWAAREAESRGRPLLVVDVLGGPLPEPAFAPMAEPLPEALDDESVRRYAERELAEVAADCERLCAGLDVRTRLAQGHPADALSTLGRDAALLVVGSSGRSGLSRALLGSTTADLVNGVNGHRLPVVVARDDGAGEGPVVVGLDGSATSDRAVGFAFDLAARRGRELVAVHAWADLPAAALAPVREEAIRRQVLGGAEDLVDRCLAPHRARHPDVWVSRMVAFDGPAHALLEHAKDASLLVVGSHGRGPVRRVLLGSVSHAVLYHASCSVAVVRREDDDVRRDV
ncbi:MAG: universal stress protein [Saccharothrix sp.]|nr:universal stress protein [Saccharothrix sp.]